MQLGVRVNTDNNVDEFSPSPAGNTGKSLIKLFQVGYISAESYSSWTGLLLSWEGFFPDFFQTYSV